MIDETDALVRKLVEQHWPTVAETLGQFMHEHDTEVGIEVVLDIVTSIMSMCLMSIYLTGANEQETVKVILRETMRKTDMLKKEYENFTGEYKNKMH